MAAALFVVAAASPSDAAGATDVYDIVLPFGDPARVGYHILAPLTADSGWLYGVAEGGPGGYGQPSAGVVFRVHEDGTGYQILHRFGLVSTDGYVPNELVFGPDHRLYGTTRRGGKGDRGSVYSLAPDSPAPDVGYKLIYSFPSTSSTGGTPLSGLTVAGGRLFGMASEGGFKEAGVIFRITTNGDYAVHAEPGRRIVLNGTPMSFDPPAAGNTYQWPRGLAASLALGPDGLLYGTSQGGGASNGVVFAVSPTNGAVVTVYADLGDIGLPKVLSTERLAFGTNATGPAVFGTSLRGGDVGPTYGEGGGVLFFTGLYDPASGNSTVVSRVVFGGLPGVDPPTRPLDPAMPSGPLISHGGQLYGASVFGGDGSQGSIYRIDTVHPGYVPEPERLYSFAYQDEFGIQPYAGLVTGSDGALYGATSIGSLPADGSIYRFEPDAGTSPTLLFATLKGGGLGSEANGDLAEVTDRGELWGMTRRGGRFGMGTVFKTRRDGSSYQTVLDFGDSLVANNSGRMPNGGLVRVGNYLYGLTPQGDGGGIVFKINPLTAGTTSYRRLHAFQSGDDGSYPYGTLTRGTAARGDAGMLYGVTTGENSNPGSVFRIDTDHSDAMKTLRLFSPATPAMGVGPASPLLAAANGRLYGLTATGGDTGSGVVYSLSTNGADYRVEARLQGGAPEELFPLGGLVERGGRFFGISIRGGDFNGGTVFELVPDGTPLRLLHHFAGSMQPVGGQIDGTYPYGTPRLGLDNLFYGVTAGGGAYNSGVLYRFDPDADPSGNMEILHAFHESASDASAPAGGLLSASDGKLYGAAPFGGIAGDGVLFSFAPGNSAPVFDPAKLPDARATNGLAFDYIIPSDAFVDPNPGQTVALGAGNLPGWLSFDPVTRSFHGIPDAAGPLDIAVTASDSSSPPATVTGTLHLTVAESPVALVRWAVTTLAVPETQVDGTNRVVWLAIVKSGVAGGTVNFSVDTGGRANPADLDRDVAIERSGSRAFGGGTVTNYISLEIEDDLLDEGDERFVVHLVSSDPAKVTVTGDAALEVTILDDDAGIATRSVPAHVFGATTGADVVVNVAVPAPATGVGGWRLAWERAWRRAGDRVTIPTDLPSVDVVFEPLAGLRAPEPATVMVALGQTTVLDRAYTTVAATTGSLRVDLAPSGGKWRMLGEGGAYTDSGGTRANLPAGQGLVEIQPAAGFLVPEPQPVQVLPGANNAFAFSCAEGTVQKVGAPAVVSTLRLEDHTTEPDVTYIGQLVSPAGSGSGVAVMPHTVLTAAHMAFDLVELAPVPDLRWAWKRARREADATTAGTSDPAPIYSRGSYMLGGYALQRSNDMANPGLGGAPSLASSALDAATLWFAGARPARGGQSGFLVALGAPGPWLIDTNPVALAGYPQEGLGTVPGLPHLGSPGKVVFDASRYPVLVATGLPGFPGNSGGPVFAFGPKPPGAGAQAMFPAGIFLGQEPNGYRVRVIDTNVVALIELAESSSRIGTNYNSGGVTRFDTTPAVQSHRQSLSVRFDPASGGAQLSPNGPVKTGPTAGYRVVPGTYTLVFTAVAGYRTPDPYTFAVGPDVDLNLEVHYAPSGPALGISGASGLVALGAKGLKVQLQFAPSIGAGTLWQPLGAQRSVLTDADDLSVKLPGAGAGGYYRLLVVP